ncbi:MAG: site-specific DNA-methyltransferase [Nitrospirae bacterium]|nr:site-specific DNA-methyltransferase [Nitrospirota bacterium]
MTTNHKIIIGDSRNLSEIPDNSIHLIVTSPPYWQLKDYGDDNQIGYNDTYQDYINNLNLVWCESYRVLHDGCRLCINIGDQFARSLYYGRYKVIPIRTEIIKFCETIGLDYMGAIIWQKATTCNTTGGAAIMGSYPYPRNGLIKLDYEFILIFKKPGEQPMVDKKVKEESIMTKEEWNQYFHGHWNFVGAKQTKHLAMFPEELPKRLIKMFTFKGETVLDPFLGSGTTMLAARNLDRNSVGYEVNQEFLPIIKTKLNIGSLIDEDYEIIYQRDETDFKERINNLPYIFSDPVKINVNVDPKKMGLRSRIDKDSTQDETYHSIKRIISPELIELKDGITVRLIGIKAIADKDNEAVDFLLNKTKGQQIFLKFDEIKYDSNNNLLCYMYLKNKTFINAHLIKKELVEVDISYNYRYKKKFILLMGSKGQVPLRDFKGRALKGLLKMENK